MAAVVLHVGAYVADEYTSRSWLEIIVDPHDLGFATAVLDVRLDIARTLEAAHGSRFSPPQILIDMVAEGKLGVKSGEGFFSWPQ